MESVLGRYRNLIILVGVLFLQVLGLAVQVKRSSTDVENTRLIRIWAVRVITPLERGLVWAQNGAGNLWHNYFYLRGVRAENRELKEQIDQMRLEQVRLSEDAAQARRLQSLLAFKEQFIAKTVAAQVIGSSGSDLSRSIYIDKGSDAGIQQDMAVITAGGIVGKVLRVYPSTSLVLLINDQSSGVGAVLEKTRLQGVLKGTANGEIVLDRVMSDEEVPLGETVLTSGGDQIFPKGLPIGTVAKVGGGKELFLSVKVKPAANLSKLEEVLVVLQKQERQATTQDTVRVRAADILAQRLPSVPDKPATDAKPAGSGPAGNTPGANTPGTTSVTGSSAGTKPQAQPRTERQPTGTAVKPSGSVGSTSTGSGHVGSGTPRKTTPDAALPGIRVNNTPEGTARPKPANSEAISETPDRAQPQTAQPATVQPETQPKAVPSPPPPAAEDSPH